MALFQGLAHVAIYTKNMEESIAFYEKLGGRTLDRAEMPGNKLLALVDFCGVVLELVQFPGGVTELEGCISHFAIAVEDVDAAAKLFADAGVESFETPETTVLPSLFGGLDNRFFKGPSGERIELLHMHHGN